MEILSCELNEIKSKHFLKKFHKFTNNSFRIEITWKARTIRSLFSLKNKSDYKSCVIYKGDCSCGSRYTGENSKNSLKAYKISLNVDKTKLVLFVFLKKKLDNNLKTKLNEKRLFETDELSFRIVITWKLEIYVCFL